MCHGCGLQARLIPVSTFMWAGVSDRPVYVLGHYGDSVWDGYRILLILWGRHTLTSPEGGGPCPLGTLNYRIAGHLAY